MRWTVSQKSHAPQLQWPQRPQRPHRHTPVSTCYRFDSNRHVTLIIKREEKYYTAASQKHSWWCLHVKINKRISAYSSPKWLLQAHEDELAVPALGHICRIFCSPPNDRPARPGPTPWAASSSKDVCLGKKNCDFKHIWSKHNRREPIRALFVLSAFSWNSPFCKSHGAASCFGAERRSRGKVSRAFLFSRLDIVWFEKA